MGSYGVNLEAQRKQACQIQQPERKLLTLQPEPSPSIPCRFANNRPYHRVSLSKGSNAPQIYQRPLTIFHGAA